MDEFPGILSRDFGLRPQGKAAPMSSSRRGFGSSSGYGSAAAGSGFPGDLLGGDRQSGQGLHSGGGGGEDDIFFGSGGRAAPPKYASSGAAFGSDPFFQMGAARMGSSPPMDAGFSSSMPVFDKPVYDDDGGDIFSGVAGMKKSSSASAAVHGDVFSPPAYEDDLLASLGGSRPGLRGSGDNGRPGDTSPPYDDGDLLASFGKSGGRKGPEAVASNRASPPYDDDLLAGLGGGKSYSDSKRSGDPSSNYSYPSYEDDLLAGLGGLSKRSSDEGRSQEQGVSGFDDLIPGFGGSSPPEQKSGPSENKHQQSSVSATKSTVTMAEDPFVVLESTSAAKYSSSGLFTDPLETISKPSGSMKSDVSSAKGGGLFDDINGFDSFTKSKPSFSSGIEDNSKDRSTLETSGKMSAGEPSVEATDNLFPKMVPVDQSHQTLFDKPIKSSETFTSVHINDRNLDADVNPYDAGSKVNATRKPEEQPVVDDDDAWLIVSEIPLFTQPTSAPPPSRPPPRPAFRSKQGPFASQGEGSSIGLNVRRKATESSYPQPNESYPFPNSRNDMPRKSAVSSLDELEDFAMGKPQTYVNEVQFGEEENEANSTAAASAAAMKQAMDRAEAKFKHAREVRERERDLKSSKNRETAQEVRDEDEKEKERLYHEREQREREEKEQKRLEKMRELELEREREREKARQAVERATREARERAAAEARQKAEKAAREQAERAAVQRAQAEARERAAAEAKERAEKLAAERERAEAEARERSASEAREKAARERAEAEARERAAAEARERAMRERATKEKAAMEAREKAERAAVERAAAEARARAQRAAVERATAEARERAAAEARERAAAMAREKQQRNDNDLDSFFGMSARANSAPRERSTPMGSVFDAQSQTKGTSDGKQKTSSVSSSNMKRPSSTTNFMDDLTSVFRTSSSYEEFQEIEGEPEERRRARLDREQRARARAAKALAEKNEREMQMQREQAERDRISDTLNVEIRRWAAGKDGNLRALLSTLQYVLWPDSGWQPVSLTDLITAASVKKVYRKATLCVHPDKVVNGTVQQKYIAEKVFDLLKEAWNKFNSEELF